jgi:DNA invertase Pin-like site-specific DNA recombinase
MEHWGYARISTNTEKQAAGFEDQKAVLSAKGVTVTYEEQASAGGTRPVFDTMIEKAIAHAEDTGTPVAIHVTKMDRGFRDLEQALRTIKRTPKFNVYWVLHDIAPTPINPSDPAQALLVSVLGAIGQFEKDRFAERRAVGIAKAKKDGKYKGRAPTARAKADQVIALHERSFSADEIAKQLSIGIASVYRILKDHRTAQEAC